jgi:hypothetical protein
MPAPKSPLSGPNTDDRGRDGTQVPSVPRVVGRCTGDRRHVGPDLCDRREIASGEGREAWHARCSRPPTSPSPLSPHSTRRRRWGRPFDLDAFVRELAEVTRTTARAVLDTRSTALLRHTSILICDSDNLAWRASARVLRRRPARHNRPSRHSHEAPAHIPVLGVRCPLRRRVCTRPNLSPARTSRRFVGGRERTIDAHLRRVDRAGFGTCRRRRDRRDVVRLTVRPRPSVWVQRLPDVRRERDRRSAELRRRRGRAGGTGVPRHLRV